MNFYIKSLFIAVPTFIILIVLEMIVSRMRGIKVNEQADIISSLSSGMTNTIKDSFRFSVVIISYSWLLDTITVIEVEPLWIAVFIAFLVQDFTGYWMHRLNHRVNIFWNRHIIHHSSEEFNLSCALRQTISETFKFSAILMVPAALLGIPTYIFAVLGPIHLFMQFWYHTRLIDKMGFLEKIIVTPSHHRVHHAINPEYLDKNYGQILIIWDKMFNTFQEEIKAVEPVYGTLRPVSTWNPIIINFKHILQLVKDAWYAERLVDKFKIWFMPTGWRPKDVEKRFPLRQFDDPFSQIKYSTENPKTMLVWSWMQHIIAGIMMFHLFTVMNYGSPLVIDYLYAVFIFSHIFSLTSLLDLKRYSLIVESFKMLMGLILIYIQDIAWYNLNGLSVFIIIGYLFLSAFITAYFILIRKNTLTI